MKRNHLGQFAKGTNGNTFEGFGIWYDTKGYPCIWIDGKGIRLHVYIWERVNGSKPKGHDVHHRDFNRQNYNIENLELLSFSDHRKVHAGWIRKNGEWIAKPCTRCGVVKPLSEFYPRKGYTPTALCKPCWIVFTAERNKGIPEKRRLYNQRWYAKRKEVMPNAKE